MLQDQDTARLDRVSRMYGTGIESDDWTSPSRAHSTEDGPFSVSPWAPEDWSNGNGFFRLQDLCNVLQGTFNEASSSSGSARRSIMPESVKSDSADSDTRDVNDDRGCSEVSILNTDEDMDAVDEVYAEGVGFDLPLRSPTFQMRVFDPGSTDYEISNEYTTETIKGTAEDWSGKVLELPPISEEVSSATEATDLTAMDVKRRSSDTVVQIPLASSSQGIRRVSTMSDYHRLKGPHNSPKLVAFKADSAGPAMTEMYVQPAEAWRVNSMNEESTDSSHSRGLPVRETSQTIQSNLGISRLLWKEPSSSSGSEITVITGSGVDYLVADDIEEESTSSSPMERLKTKLKAWSWERELSDGSPDNRSRFIPLRETEERRHRRQSSDFLENPPGPPNTVHHSGQSSMIHSDAQTPVDLESLEDDEDDCVIELKTKSFPRPFTNHSPSVACSTDHLAIPRRTASLPSSRTMPEGEDDCFPHRDSVEISRARMDWDEIKDKRSQELIMNSRDSFLLNKSRLEAKYPKRFATPPTGAITWSRFGGLSPIVDASPPGVCLLEATRGKQKVEVCETPKHPEDEVRTGNHKAGSSSKKKVEVVEALTHHPDEHGDYPICEVHRPRWFEDNHREW